MVYNMKENMQTFTKTYQRKFISQECKRGEKGWISTTPLMVDGTDLDQI